MTEQEAIDLLRFAYPKGFTKPVTEQVITMAISALEKQIPKNLVCIEDKFLHCPCCDEALSYKWEKYPTEKINLDWLKCCWNCGQAIKWE